MSKIGKWFEGRMRTCLNELQSNHGTFFYRLKDSHSAGRIIGNTPADYLVAMAGQIHLWEAKASEIHYSLRSCCADMVDDGQVGYHALWNFNRCQSYFFFYSDQTGQVEIWPGEEVVLARKEKRPLYEELLKDNANLKELKHSMLKLFTLRRKDDYPDWSEDTWGFHS